MAFIFDWEPLVSRQITTVVDLDVEGAEAEPVLPGKFTEFLIVLVITVLGAAFVLPLGNCEFTI